MGEQRDSLTRFNLQGRRGEVRARSPCAESGAAIHVTMQVIKILRASEIYDDARMTRE